MTTPGQADDAAWAAKLAGGRPPVPIVQGAPPAANVVGGRGAAVGAEVLRVPAGRTWRGEVHLASSSSAAIGAAAAVHVASLNLAGAGAAATPAPGVLLELATALPATAATAVMGSSGRADANMPLVIVAGTADAVVTLAGTATAMRASARGELIA